MKYFEKGQKASEYAFWKLGCVKTETVAKNAWSRASLEFGEKTWVNVLKPGMVQMIRKISEEHGGSVVWRCSKSGPIRCE